MASAIRLSSVCNVVAPDADSWTYLQYFCTLAYGLGKFVLKFWEKFEGVLGDRAS